eukprot:CAMPEP_0116121856 /NCGR_PEP_ID=MMETSP0329-20121206/3914_1 /TAXON_ID=697910 /ORGANISM="Pseudo-nitzschia arenysensis, Strain B593" /LENGTH=625 /DNA_ID=CAMNT_0003615685 /DNA_START=133 /DNA_END=2010 /DNA_ORIENTATION=+
MSGIGNEAVRPNEGDNESVGSEMQRILRVAGIESAMMDPSSANCLRELIAVELEKKGTKDDVGQQDRNSCSMESKPTLAPTTTAFPTTTIVKNSDSSSTNTELSKQADFAKLKQAPTSSIDHASDPNPTKSGLDIVSQVLGSSPDEVGSSFMAKNTIQGEETIPASVRNLLSSQQKTLDDQSKALKLLTTHIEELTKTVNTLQQSVERLQGSKAPFPMQQTAAPMRHMDDLNNATDNFRNENIPNNFRHENNNHNDFQRAHMLAHHVAWRIATFPLRAMFFYLKYEYRIWLVMYRLARREVLNPFREAGMIFQLGFALIIVYGRIAPALENAVNERRREQQQQEGDSSGGDGGGGNDDYYEYDEAFLEDAEFQIQTIVTAIIVGFLYHVGVFGLVYRFFFRDRLHIRIWKDLREGVELTPTYGLDFDLVDEPNGTDENENDFQNANNPNRNENENNFGNENNDNQAGRDNNRNGDDDNNNNNGVPRPPNRNHNRGNANDDGPLFEMLNAIGNGVNDFFMGHRRRRQAAAQEPAGQNQEQPEAAIPNHNHRNPIIGLISDILCLFYSFFVSILPGWNYEQQLRDMRDEEDMRLRAIMEREAEALRNQHIDDSDESEESDSEDEDDM